MRNRLRSPRGLATVHTPEGMPLPPKILVCAAIVKMRDEHRLRGSCTTELLEFYRAYYRHQRCLLGLSPSVGTGDPVIVN
jgi:hypothetical protein